MFGYLHIHSKYSDGDYDLEKIKEVFSKMGANFIFLADHEERLDDKKFRDYLKECSRLSDNNFLIIPGLEINVGKNHLLALNAEQIHHENNLIEKIKKYKDDGCLIVWAHPHKNKFKIDEKLFELLDGIEVWNSLYDGKIVPRFSSLKVASSLPDKKKLLCALDFHRAAHSDGPKIFLKSKILEKDAVIQELKSGNYKIGKNTEMEMDKVELNSLLTLISFLSITLIRIFRISSKILSILNIKVPKKIKVFLRRKI